MTTIEGSTVTVVGEPVAGPDYLKGYNTFWDEEEASITAATSGIVEVVERVISVRGLSPKYYPEVGDIVVGRIAEVSGNRWKCSIGAQQDAIMLLANVTEPGGVLRRRGREDELTMRNIFQEGDVLVAEVQRLLSDGTISLHTRSASKFGRMSQAGQLLAVNPSLVKRVKHHFYTFKSWGVFTVLGVNGRLWIAPATEEQLALDDSEGDMSDDDQGEGEGGDEGRSASLTDPYTVRVYMARLRNSASRMSALKLPISPSTLAAAVKASIQSGISPIQILDEDFTDTLVSSVEAVKVSAQGRLRKRPRE